jgi:outer membrane immunogenic protein
LPTPTTNGQLFLPAVRSSTRLAPTVTLTFNDRDNDDEGGFVGGGQIGYNYQIGTFRPRLRDRLPIRRSRGPRRSLQQPPATPSWDPPAWRSRLRPRPSRERHLEPRVVRHRSRPSRLRLRPALIYATGGFAYGFSDGGDEFCGRLFNGCSGGDDTRFGYTVGGGLEYAFTNNVTAKIEGST